MKSLETGIILYLRECERELVKQHSIAFYHAQIGDDRGGEGGRDGFSRFCFWVLNSTVTTGPVMLLRNAFISLLFIRLSVQETFHRVPLTYMCLDPSVVSPLLSEIRYSLYADNCVRC